MPTASHTVMTVIVLLLSAYSALKFAFFFILSYPTRRAAVDKSYPGRTYGTATADTVLLVIAGAVGVALLATRFDPIAFLGGIFVGATLIQMFFHAFHVDPPANRQAPEPRSPLKRLSYAIQDRPGRAAREMLLYVALVLAATLIWAMPGT